MSTGGDTAAQADRVGDALDAHPVRSRSSSKVNVAINTDSSEQLPVPVKRRLKALKCLQLETTKLEAQFYEEVQQLEVKYHKLYTPHYEKRAQIVNGNYEPNDEECVWDLDSDGTDSEDSEDGDKGRQKKGGKEDKKADAGKVEKSNEGATEKSEASKDEKPAEKENVNKEGDDVRGIPDFWLTVFKNANIIEEMVQEYDEPILKHLKDVKIVYDTNPMTFTIEFSFVPNEFFTNGVLTKRYEMKCTPDADDPFSFEGPEIFKSTGCEINWNKGMDVTVKMVKKKQKHKSRGVVRTVVRPVQRDSFFNFFSPPELPEDPDAEVDEDTYALVTADIEVGHVLRDRVVPRAVLYFTGEADDEEIDDDLSSSSSSIDYSEDEGEEGREGEEEEEEGQDDEDERAAGENTKSAAGDKTGNKADKAKKGST